MDEPTWGQIVGDAHRKLTRLVPYLRSKAERLRAVPADKVRYELLRQALSDLETAYPALRRPPGC